VINILSTSSEHIFDPAALLSKFLIKRLLSSLSAADQSRKHFLTSCRYSGLSIRSHPSIHGFIGQAVGFFVAAAEGVAHLEAVEVGGAAF
jgi:hypothetical protein